MATTHIARHKNKKQKNQPTSMIAKLAVVQHLECAKSAIRRSRATTLPYNRRQNKTAGIARPDEGPTQNPLQIMMTALKRAHELRSILLDHLVTLVSNEHDLSLELSSHKNNCTNSIVTSAVCACACQFSPRHGGEIHRPDRGWEGGAIIRRHDPKVDSIT